MFRAYTVFLLCGGFFVLVGALPYLRFLWWVATRSPEVSGHVQSLVIGGVLVLFGIVLVVLGVVADLLSVNRKLVEDVLLRLKRLEYGEGSDRAVHDGQDGQDGQDGHDGHDGHDGQAARRERALRSVRGQRTP